MNSPETLSDPNQAAIDLTTESNEVVIFAGNIGEATAQVLAHLQEAGIDYADCMFSGHADLDLRAKEDTDFEEYGYVIPDEASDDALLFWFADSLPDEATQNPLWYAFNSADDIDQDPILDVFSKEALIQTVPNTLLSIETSGISEAWLTEHQLDSSRICRFIIKC